MSFTSTIWIFYAYDGIPCQSLPFACAVILDHGLYRDLDEKFRTNFCRLWRALILLDGDEILETGRNLGAGQYAHFLPVIFTGRAISRYKFLSFYEFQFYSLSLSSEPLSLEIFLIA